LIGNSSSGIIDAPYFKIPSINVGSRQDGRLRHLSVIDTAGDVNSILEAIKIATSNEFRKSLNTLKKAEALNPENIKTKISIGNAYVQMKDYENALNAFHKLSESNPEYAADGREQTRKFARQNNLRPRLSFQARYGRYKECSCPGSNKNADRKGGYGKSLRPAGYTQR